MNIKNKSISIIGASGYIGSAVCSLLTQAGADITAICSLRSKKKFSYEKKLICTEDDVDDSKFWNRIVEDSDVIVHVAQIVGPTMEIFDKKVINGIISGSDKNSKRIHIVYTSGTMGFGCTPKSGVDENSQFGLGGPDILSWRARHERLVTKLCNEHGHQLSIIRPGYVYGDGKGMLSMLFDRWKTIGYIDVIGDGQNYWSMVHRSDLAKMYRAVISSSFSKIYHGVDNSPVKFIEIAKSINRIVNPENTSLRRFSTDDASKFFGPIGSGFALNQRIYTKNSKLIDWIPVYSSVLSSLESEYNQWLNNSYY